GRRAEREICVPRSTTALRLILRLMAAGPSRITGLASRLPLDVASNAGFLIRRNRRARQYGIQRRAQILAGDLNAIARAAVVKLAAINQFLLPVEKVNIRRASGVISFGHRLGFVVQIRKRVTG